MAKYIYKIERSSAVHQSGCLWAQMYFSKKRYAKKWAAKIHKKLKGKETIEYKEVAKGPKGAWYTQTLSYDRPDSEPAYYQFRIEQIQLHGKPKQKSK